MVRSPSPTQVLRHITSDFEQIFVSLVPLAASFARLASGAIDDGAQGTSHLREVIFEVLDMHNGLVAGAGAVAAPDIIPRSHYWLQWWWTRTSGGPEALRVNLDPSAPDFFDYTSTDWYQTPMHASAPHVAGPYVDYACTNEYALTVAVPVTVQNQFVGVVAADVLVSSLERQLLPALRTLACPAVLLNSAGRVIASSAPEYASGMRVQLPARPASKSGPKRILRRPPLDWHLLPASSLSLTASIG